MGLYDLAKDAYNMAQKMGNIELVKTILDLQNSLTDLMNENRETKDENSDLRKAYQSLKEIMETHNNLKFKDNAYWKENDGPFCSNCWDSNNKLIRLHTRDNIYGTCVSCKTKEVFNIEKYHQKIKEDENALMAMNNRTSGYMDW